MSNYKKWSPPSFGNTAQLKIEEMPEYQDGYDQGYQEGMQKAQLEMQQQLQAQVQQFQNMITIMQGEWQDSNSKLVAVVVKLIEEIIAVLFADAVAANPELVGKMVGDTLLPLLDEYEAIKVMVHPEHYELIRQYWDSEQINLSQIKLIPAQEVKIGGCIIDTSSIRLDASIGNKLKNIINDFSYEGDSCLYQNISNS